MQCLAFPTLQYLDSVLSSINNNYLCVAGHDNAEEIHDAGAESQGEHDVEQEPGQEDR